MMRPHFALPSPRRAVALMAYAFTVVFLSACNDAAMPQPASDSSAGQPQLLSRDQVLMGTHFGIQLVTTDPGLGAEAIDAAFDEVARVEALISEWQASSEITALNQNAGTTPTPVGPELLELVSQSRSVSGLTDGAFDITFAACGGLWSFTDQVIPTAEELDSCLSRVGMESVAIDNSNSTVFLPVRGQRIGVGGIGKGYGVDRAAAVLESFGIDDYVVDGGGDLRISGRGLDRPWTVGVAHPRVSAQTIAVLEVEDGAVVTSGDYERYFERDGVRYHHILDPRTGRPARSSVAVTVIAPDATTADALSTGLFVLGPERGMELVERLASVEALIVGPDLAVHVSSGFEGQLSAEAQ